MFESGARVAFKVKSIFKSYFDMWVSKTLRPRSESSHRRCKRGQARHLQKGTLITLHGFPKAEFVQPVGPEHVVSRHVQQFMLILITANRAERATLKGTK